MSLKIKGNQNNTFDRHRYNFKGPSYWIEDSEIDYRPRPSRHVHAIKKVSGNTYIIRNSQ